MLANAILSTPVSSLAEFVSEAAALLECQRISALPLEQVRPVGIVNAASVAHGGSS